MIRTSGKDILKFLMAHYEFVQTAFNESKPDFILDSDKFNTLLQEYNIASDTKLSVDKLNDVRFGKQLSSGDYKLSAHYTDFLQFVFKSFVLDLPATLETRYSTVFNHFTHLQAEKSPNKIVLFTNEIIKEIDSFLIDIDSETTRLLEDTESLKVNSEDNADLSVRLQKASYWIDEYIIPLNAILDKEHPNSIVHTISQIQRYSSEKRLIEDDAHLRREFEKLYACTVNARTELDKTLSKLTRELLPLLERIKSDSIILSGFYHFVENVDYPDEYIVPLPNLLRKTNPNVCSKSFSDEALFYVDQFNYKPQEVFYTEQTHEIEWLPDISQFKELLLKEKEVDNFYQWCFDTLSVHTDDITIAKYFSLSNLILEEDLEVEYSNAPRFEIQLSDAKLQLLKVRIYEKLPTRT